MCIEQQITKFCHEMFVCCSHVPSFVILADKEFRKYETACVCMTVMTM